MCEDEGMSKKALGYEPIQLMENQLKYDKGRWLTEHGWKESCNFVDGCWRWCKEINDVPYMCDLQEAINIEYNYLDQ